MSYLRTTFSSKKTQLFIWYLGNFTFPQSNIKTIKVTQLELKLKTNMDTPTTMDVEQKLLDLYNWK